MRGWICFVTMHCVRNCLINYFFVEFLRALLLRVAGFAGFAGFSLYDILFCFFCTVCLFSCAIQGGYVIYGGILY